MSVRNGAHRALTGIALIAGLLTASVTSAANILVTTGWLNGHETFDLVRGSTSFNGVQAGGFTGKWNGTPIVFWCAELDQSFSLGGTYNDYTASTISGGSADLLAELFTEAYASAGSSQDNSAAFQLAVWEILYEGGPLDVTSGNFHVTNAHGNTNAETIANQWLANLPPASSYTISMLSSGSHQNFDIGNLPPSRCCGNAPEPPMLPLLATAFGVFAVARWRYRAGAAPKPLTV